MRSTKPLRTNDPVAVLDRAESLLIGRALWNERMSSAFKARVVFLAQPFRSMRFIASFDSAASLDPGDPLNEVLRTMAALALVVREAQAGSLHRLGAAINATNHYGLCSILLPSTRHHFRHSAQRGGVGLVAVVRYSALQQRQMRRWGLTIWPPCRRAG